MQSQSYTKVPEEDRSRSRTNVSKIVHTRSLSAYKLPRISETNEGIIFSVVIVLAIAAAGMIPQALGANRYTQSTFFAANRAFEFNYTNSLVLCRRDPKQSDWWRPDESCEAYSPVCSNFGGNPAGVVACVAYPAAKYQGSNFEAAAFAVSVLKDKRTENACLSNLPEEFKSTLHSEIVNHVNFATGISGSVAMGNVQTMYIYRSFHEKECYELDINISEQNDTPYGPGQGPRGFGKAEYNKVHASLRHVLGSFRFIE